MGFVKLVLFLCGPIGWIAIAMLNSHERQRERELEQAKKEAQTHTD